MQASRSAVGAKQISSILYHEEGIFRFWKGSSVMALGCIPAHASYFMMYETLKSKFSFHNEELNVSTTLFIGSTTTFAHDFFIAPADRKYKFIRN